MKPLVLSQKKNYAEDSQNGLLKLIFTGIIICVIALVAPPLTKTDFQKDDEAKEYAAIIRGMIKHENELIHYRTTWLTTIQGFLFGALALAWDKNGALYIISLLSGAGILTSITSSRGISNANKAINNLKRWWDERYKDYPGPDVVGYRGDTQQGGFVKKRRWGHFNRMFIYIWMIVLLLSIGRELHAHRRQIERALGEIRHRTGARS